MFRSPCQVENSTRQICVSWTKPNGGNAIDNYTLEWSIRDNVTTELATVEHIRNMSAYTHTINSLSPGQMVNFSIKARNSAGTGVESSFGYASGKIVS